MIIQLTPRGILNTFFRHRYKFGSIFFLIFGLAATYCAIATPKFESDAALLVKFAPSQSGPDGLPPVGIAAQQLERKEVVNSQIGVLQSNDLLVSVLNTITIGTLYPSLASIPDVNQRYGKALVRLNKDLDVQPQKDASIIWLSLLNPDANVAARTLNALIDKFIAKQSTIYQSAQLPFMQGQLEDARQKLEKSRAAVEAFKAATGINSFDEERTFLLRQQSDNQESLTQAISRQQEAQGRFKRLEALLKNMPADIKLSDENDRFRAVDDSRQRLDDLLAQQHQFGTNYRSDSTTMETLNSQISFAQQQLSSASKQSAARIRTGANPVRQQAEIGLVTAAGDQDGATASRTSFESELARIKQKLSALEGDSERLDSLQLQQQVDEENFRNYLQAVNDARVSDDLNRQRISNIAIVQSPTVPAVPVKPRTLFILAAGFLLGLAAAIAATLLAEMADEAFSTADQIESVLGLPVLGTFTMRDRMTLTRTPAYVKLLPLLVLLAGLALPSIAFGFDQLDPAYGQRLVVRDSHGAVTETLYPDGGKFDRTGPHGEQLGWAQRLGPTLIFYDPDGRLTSTASRQLLPPNYPLTAIAVVRDISGNPIGMVARH
jgi:polysaccharide biosynthesis protein PslE